MATRPDPTRDDEPTRQLTVVRSNGSDGAVPRLAPGVELLGRYKGSGYKDPPFLARRPDGQIVQLPALLYALAERADGSRSVETVATELSEALQRGIDA